MLRAWFHIRFDAISPGAFDGLVERTAVEVAVGWSLVLFVNLVADLCCPLLIFAPCFMIV